MFVEQIAAVGARSWAETLRQAQHLRLRGVHLGSALMNSSLTMSWGSWTVTAWGVRRSSERERGGERVNRLLYTRGNGPSVQRGRRVSQRLLFFEKSERNSNQLGCFPVFFHFLGDGLVWRPAWLLSSQSSQNFCVNCRFLHFKSFGNEFTCLRLIPPGQLDAQSTRLPMLTPVLCCELHPCT